MNKTYKEQMHNKIDTLSIEDCKLQLKLYYNSFGVINPLYNKCGRCIHYDEYGCWRERCIRFKPTLTVSENKESHIKANDYKKEEE